MIDPLEPDYANTPVHERRPAYGYVPRQGGAAPAVSIVTPFRNTGAIFHQTAQSVLRQSLQQWEWIVVDDGSTDPESVAMVDGYAGRDPRIRVLRPGTWQGVSAARNLGAAEARSDYLFFLDSDDLIEPTTIEKLRWFLDCRPELSFANGYTVGFGAREFLWREGFHSVRKFLEENCTTITTMIRREVYRSAGGMRPEMRDGLEDWDFWMRCAARGYWGETVPEFFEWSRHHPDPHGRNQPDRLAAFGEALRVQYPDVFANGVRQPSRDGLRFPAAAPFENALGTKPGVKRLLFLLAHFEIGGAEQFSLTLMERLQQDHAWEVTVVASVAGNHPWLHRFEQLTPDVFALPHFLPAADYFRFVEYLLHSRGHDAVLVSQSQLGYQILPYLRSAGAGPVFADYLHIEDEAWRSGGYPAQSLHYAPFLDRTMVSSEHLKRWMMARGGDAARIHVCTTNVDPAVWDRERYARAAIREKYGVPGEVPVIACVCRMCEQKQPVVLAQVIHRLKQRGLAFVCLAAGDGPYLPYLETFTRANELDELRLVGARSIEEVREIVALADLFFLPSKMEGIALTIYEAMSMGVVPVAADVGGQRELVTPECGVLVEPGPNQVEAYVGILAELLGDPGKRLAMAARCRERICHGFSLRAMGDRVAALLDAPVDRPFDFAAAFQAGRPGVAAEFAEQDAFERRAVDLWRAGSATIPPEDVASLAPEPPPPPPPPPPDDAYLQALALTGRVARGNLLLLPRLARQCGIGWRHGVSALGLILSPAHWRRNAKNLALLRRVLADPRALERLPYTFDARFYRECNPDIRYSQAIPLLHYALVGYLENRRPAEEFVAESAENGVNPLLWNLLRFPQPRAGHAADGQIE